MPAEIKDLVSVIIPAYNAEKYIKDAIDSVLKQTYPYFEIIVVDDASQDKTVEIVRSFKDERIRLIQHEKNQGPGAARNTATEAAKGRWIALLDADGQWHPQRLEKLIPLAVEGEEKYFVADDSVLCFETVSGLKPWGSSFKLHYDIQSSDKIMIFNLGEYLKHRSPLFHPIIPLNPVKKFNLSYNTSCFMGEDTEFYCHLFRCGLNLKLLLEPLYIYRLTPEALSARPERFEDLGRVYERLLKEKDFTEEECRLLKIRLEKVKRDKYFATLASSLKNFKWGKAINHTINNPWLITEIFRRIPKTLRYRFKARKLGGIIK